MKHHPFDGPAEFDAEIRRAQQNILWEDRLRNRQLFYNGMFDFRCNGTLKRVGLLVWAAPVLVGGLAIVLRLLDGLARFSDTKSLFIAAAICLFVGIPAIGSSAAAVWVACFLHAPGSGNHHLHDRQ